MVSRPLEYWVVSWSWPNTTTADVVVVWGVHDIKSILSQPMTRDRSLQKLYSLCPDLQLDISKLPPGSIIGELWYGKWNVASDLTKLWYRVIGIDKQAPTDKITMGPLFRYVQGDLEDASTRQLLLDNSIDYMNSFFTTMYLKDPFALLPEIQKKLRDWGHALVHLWYEEQYIGWLDFIRKQLAHLKTWQVWIWDQLCTELLHESDDDAMYIWNASVILQPIFVRFWKEDNLSTIESITSTPGMYIDYAWSKYKLRFSDEWYMYSPLTKNNAD